MNEKNFFHKDNILMKDSSPPQLMPKQRSNDIFIKTGTTKLSSLESHQEVTTKRQAVIR